MHAFQQQSTSTDDAVHGIDMYNQLRSIVLKFQIPSGAYTNISVSPLKGGLIHNTYLVRVNPMIDGQTNAVSSYILQQVNTEIFHDSKNLMHNISIVINHIESKRNGDDPKLAIIPTLSGEHYWHSFGEHDTSQIWRMYNYIPNSITYPVAPSTDFLIEAGKAYGRFQCILDDISPSLLHEIIPDFHNTPKRLEAFRKAVLEDICQRAQEVQEEVRFIEMNSWLAYSIVTLLDNGKLPKRVVHNDTKLENVLFDKDTNKALCVIDYDTIMPNGCLLYDFGDAIRSMASSSVEDEQDLDKVSFMLNFYSCFTKGFLNEVTSIISDEEVAMLPMGAIVITFEQAIRFLTDYLMGDVYFKVTCPRHNLFRARNQLKLIKEMLEKKDDMDAVVRNHRHVLLK